MGWESAMDDAKKGHRPSLKNWARDKFATTRAAEFEGLASKIIREEETARCRVAKESALTLTPQEFIEKYEKNCLPVLLTGIVRQEEWPAQRRWTLERLKEDFRDRKFKCGEDDDGYTIKVTMRNFVKYTQNQVDDSPLYIFDSHFDDDFSAKRILDDYRVPKYFPTNPDQEHRPDQSRGNDNKNEEEEEDNDENEEVKASSSSSSSIQSLKHSLGSVDYHDLFSLVGEKRRPPYRWFLLGPKRSGTCVHIDPLLSSAWNTVVSGKKLWVLFPPGTPKSIVKAKRQILSGEDDEAINYFIDLIPRLKRDYPTLDVYQFIQNPGDTVFIPGGWWHAVLNLDDSVAITQNFCSKTNFEKVWKETRSGRKKMALKWLRCLRIQYPDLAETAERLNEEDGFVMPFDKKIPSTSTSSSTSSSNSSHGAAAAESETERGREISKSSKSSKSKSSKKLKSKSRSSSSKRKSKEDDKINGGDDKILNDDGRKKHPSILDHPQSPSDYIDIDHQILHCEDGSKNDSDDNNSDDSTKKNKRKIDKVAGALAGIEMN